jgi:hypothetical protein
MAGLLAARVLSDRFPEGPVSRKGVPRSRHLHVLWLRGQTILERHFPGLREELVATGATFLDTRADSEWLTPAAPDNVFAGQRIEKEVSPMSGTNTTT